jgi:hypothetical protein
MHKAAGGIKSRNIVEKPVKTGVGARGVDKKWVSQIGQSMGNKATNKSKIMHGVRAVDPYKGESFRPVPLGNALVNNVGKGGPGTGRDVRACGSQGQHGSVNPGGPKRT